MFKPQAENELIMEFADHTGEMGSARIIIVTNPITPENDKPFHLHLSDNSGDECLDDVWYYNTLVEAKTKMKLLISVCLIGS